MLELEKEALAKLDLGVVFDGAFPSNPHLADTAAMRELAEFEKVGKPLFTLLGTTGTGKSYACAVGLVRLMVKRAKAMQERTYGSYNMAGRVLKHWDVSAMLGADGVRDRRELIKAPLVMLDDLQVHGVGKVTQPFIDWIYELVDYRHCHQLPMFITSNSTIEAFKETYGDRVTSRLNQSGYLAVVKGDDLRMKGTP